MEMVCNELFDEYAGDRPIIIASVDSKAGDDAGEWAGDAVYRAEVTKIVGIDSDFGF